MGPENGFLYSTTTVTLKTTIIYNQQNNKKSIGVPN
jgi:hypothetical protein